MKGKVEKKGAASKSLSSKSSSKNMSESFKSKEFVSSDESSSGDNKKEVGHLGGLAGLGHPAPLPRGCSIHLSGRRLTHPGPIGAGTL